MFENQLFLAVVFQEHGVFIKRPDLSCQLDAADQINRNGGFVFPNGVQKGVLNILCRLVLHVPISYFLVKLCGTALASRFKCAGTAPERPAPVNPAMGQLYRDFGAISTPPE